MFKMGGNVPKSHGVGITSGLKMKKGGLIPGKVGEPILKKMGPDGKEREMQNPLATLLGPAAMALLRSGAGLAGRGLGSMGIAPKFLSNFASRGPRVKDFLRFSSDPKRLEPLTKTGRGGFRIDPRTGREIPIPKTTEILAPARLKGIEQLGQAARIAFPFTAPAALGAGMALTDRLGITEKGNEDRLFETLLRETGAFGLGVSPANILSRTTQALFGDPKVEDKNLYAMLAGEGDDKKVGSKLVKESEAGETQRKQKDEFAGLSDKAERMAAAITRENNLATLSQAASNFGASALAGDDLATALRTGSQPIFDELGRRRDLQENIGGLLAQSVLADEATQSAMIAEAAKTGDPQAVNRMQKYFDAYNEGVTNILPLDAKGKIDYANMAPGTVYMDLEGVSGARYVASNSGGDDTQSFDSVEDANAFAQS